MKHQIQEFLDSTWASCLGCTEAELRDGAYNIVARPDCAGNRGCPWPLRQGPIQLCGIGDGWVLSVPSSLLEEAERLCVGRPFDQLVTREGDECLQRWFDALRAGKDPGERPGPEVYSVMNSLPVSARLRGWSHYFHWYCDASDWQDREPDRSVRPIVEADTELWQQWLVWPGDFCRPALSRTFQIANAFGYVLDGKLVSVAQVQANSWDHAYEFGVDTLPEFRRQGFATAAAGVATKWILKQNKIAWYYYDHYNTASGRVAQKLGYSLYAEHFCSHKAC